MWFKLLLVQLLVMCHTSAHHLRYVTPNVPSTEICPGHPCLSLGQFTEMADRYFNTGSIFVFLAGNHSLQAVLYAGGVSDITLRGIQNASATPHILFEKNGTIVCDKVSNFHIEELAFILCRLPPCKEESAIQFINSDQITITNCVFRGSGVAEVRSLHSRRSNITVLNCHFEGNSGSVGGAMDARSNSIINITESMFIGNIASGSGGGYGTKCSSTGLGGAIRLCNYSDLFVFNGNTFTRNMATDSGGAISADFDSSIILEGAAENVFSHNTGRFSGGALHCKRCKLTMKGSNSFLNNSVTSSSGEGGAVTETADGKLTFDSGTAVFSGNKATWGGAIAVSSSELSCSSGATVVLDGNKAENGGGMHISYSRIIQTSGCELKVVGNAAAQYGGGVSIGRDIAASSYKTVVLSGNFTNNSARCGGAVSIKKQRNVSIRYSSIVSNSAGAICISDSNVTVTATRFVNNSGKQGGGIYSLNSLLFFEDYNVFEGNTALRGGAMYLFQGTVSLDGVATFTHNSAKKDGGAVYAIGTVIDLNNAVNFQSNTAYNGGAVYLKRESLMTLNLKTHFNSSFNTALGYGGGVYHLDNPDPIQCSYNEKTPYSEVSHCFFKFKTKYIRFQIIMKSISISSYGDSAGIDGGFLYGGLLDRCRVNHDHDFLQNYAETMFQYLTESNTFKNKLTITTEDNRTQAITSPPYGLCFCDGPSNGHDCIGSRSKVLHRGQKFTVSLVAIAQGNSVTSTSVTAITSPAASLKILQNPQHLPRHCSNLTYNLYSTEGNEKVILYPDGPCHDTGDARVVLNLTLLPCPDGFILTSDGRCECEERLRQYNVSCTIDEDIFLKRKADSEYWIGAEYVNGSYEGLILYKTCPIKYCRTDEVNMTLHDLDTQCAHGHTGVLCGGCAENYSLLIGSSKCKECSNIYLLLILPFAAAGIALVAFLSILRLTVATGMINSLILYANIVQANRQIFFPANPVNLLTVFIAWLNLDLGFETCLYDGLDAFSQTCLQFAFPVYVWVLISLIILTSRYSIAVSKLIGHNPIAVLATLLLMSYTKVLKIIIVVYSSVRLDYPQNKTVAVWLKDANVPYLQSKHLILTVVTSLVLVFVFFPYTLLLLLGHKLYRWLNKMKPLLDSYYAPYKTHTRYWTGFLLLVRCALYIVFSLGGKHESLLAIIITFTAVGFAVGFVKIYKWLSINILEASVCLNLVTLSALSLANVRHQAAFANSLVATVFTATMGVIVYHFYATYMEKSVLSKLKGRVLSCFHESSTRVQSESTAHHGKSSHDPHKIVSKTVVELREPLLED